MASTGFEIAASAYGSDDQARELLERLRWPRGPVCPKCGVVNESYRVTSAPTSKTRKGLWRCRDCEAFYTVTVGTIFEDSHVGLGKWFMAIHLMCASKKGMSAHQIHRMLGVTYKTAWFMCHRIRYAMTQEPLSRMLGIVEADETFIGGKPHNKHVGKRSPAPEKAAVFSLVERGGGVRSFHVADVTGETLKAALRQNVSPKARMMTDGAAQYKTLGKEFAAHEAVDHVGNQYVKGEAHTNTVEGYFSILKRGIIGTYHHVSKAHLHRYLAEFDQRYNTRKMTDRERARKAFNGIEGKRLTYRPLVRRTERS